MIYASKSHIGSVRELNEDCCSYCAQHNFAIVADGMGGHNAGDVASKLAVSEVSNRLKSCQDITPFDIRDAVDIANKAVYMQATNDLTKSGMGTTLVVASFLHNIVCVANVGDSRAYYYNCQNESLTRITRDHSLMQEFLTSGVLSEKTAKTFPLKNVITRSVGTDEIVKADLFDVEWNENDIIIICTDGLCGYVEDDVILDLCKAHSSNLEFLCHDFIQAALKTGGKDNITVVAIYNIAPGGA